ncbi:hypothetical protein LTR53_008572 [Teratosphaeriaceae sp. CCFEE 6253]|nr:hypothetical protein LTR53_008572 [Teratosphaeriaceae sp. CCFEE 6253]
MVVLEAPVRAYTSTAPQPGLDTREICTSGTRSRLPYIHPVFNNTTLPAVMQLSTIISAALAASPTIARVVWIPERFDPNDKATAMAAILTVRAASDAETSCGPAFPDSFTCPPSTQCLALNTSTTLMSVLCCPAGQDCSSIQPVSCDQSLQNATLWQASSLHSEPTVQLDTCASGCCPMGYSCQAGQCTSRSAPVPATSVSAAPDSSTVNPIPSSTIASSTTSTIVSSSTSTPTTAAGIVTEGSRSHSHFSGRSFTAGFVPGIFLGALLTCIIFCCVSRRSRSEDSYVDEKRRSRGGDTLGSLHPLSRRPTLHGRSISEPTMAPDAIRTDFLRTTPPKVADSTGINSSYSCEVHAAGPRTPSRTPKIARPLWSRSPFMSHTPASPLSTQPPLPAHLKRGTTSWTVISPVRALKTKKSMHSLRRQMTDASGGDRRNRPNVRRSASAETVQFVMRSNDPYTPDQRAQPHEAQEPPTTLQSSVYEPHDSKGSWQTTDSEQPAAVPMPIPPPAAAPAQYASSSRYPTEIFTPTKVPLHSGNQGGSLGTPYTPNRYYGNGKVKEVLIGSDGLRVVKEPEKRDTTFSAFMRSGERSSAVPKGLNVASQARRG